MGYCSNIVGYGYCSNIVNYNYCSNVVGYGYCSNIVGYGYCSNIVNYNYCSNIVGYGYCSNIVGYGYCSNIVSLTTNWCIGSVATNYTNVANVALAGLAAPNYTLTPTGTVTVARTNLTVTAAGNTKLYDGTTSATNTPTVTAGNIQPGDTAPVWTETYATASAGTGKTLTPAGVVSDGNGGANYSYTYTPVTTGEIDPLGTTTLLAANINPAGLTATVTFTATVSSVAPAATLPTGNVVFSANGTPFATNGPPTGSGTITASTTSLAAGTDAITAEYLGDGNFQSSVSSPLSEVVTNSVIYSQTNVIVSVVNHHNGTYTLNLDGTPGAQYYVVYSGTVKAQMTTWAPVVGSTNTASPSDGTWSCVVSNPAPAYYRPVAVNPAP